LGRILGDVYCGLGVRDGVTVGDLMITFMLAWLIVLALGALLTLLPGDE
jgi:hypothetical protein